MLVRLSCYAVLLLLAACAAALPGYTPPPFKEKKQHAQAMKSGEMIDGVYEMAEQEKQMDCKRTTGSMMITIERLKHTKNSPDTSEVAVAANQVTAPLAGRSSTKGLDRDVVYARDRARLEAYNRHLASKGCRTVNIEAELAKPPTPVGKRY